jgi:hypothetical protein
LTASAWAGGRFVGIVGFSTLGHAVPSPFPVLSNGLVTQSTPGRVEISVSTGSITAAEAASTAEAPSASGDQITVAVTLVAADSWVAGLLERSWAAASRCPGARTSR